MSIRVGPHFDCREAQGPKVYELRTGERWLTALEDGEVRCWTEYHMIMIDERSGNVTIDGGYGTWAYCWRNHGCVSLHAFLYRVGFDYFMGKAAKQPHRVPDIDATIAGLQREILQDRRRGWLEKADARILWDELEDAPRDDCTEMVRHLYRDSAWSERLDCSDPSVMIDHPGMVRFWDEIWRPFCENVLRPYWLDHAKQLPIPASRALVRLAA